MRSIPDLIGLAFRSGPADHANDLISEVRAHAVETHGMGINYEVALTGYDFAHLACHVGPRLALFLRGKRRRVSNCQGVFLSVFLDDTIYFLWAADFFAYLQAGMGLDQEMFARRCEQWEQTGRSELAALPLVRGD